MAEVCIRPVVDADLPVFFEQQVDPEAFRMAAFPPRERDAFDAHWARIRVDPTVHLRTILCDGEVAGNVVSWVAGGERLVGYWIGRGYWGRGCASRGLAALLAELTERPLFARVAEHNHGSIRVLEKCGFARAGEAEGEVVFRLDR